MELYEKRIMVRITEEQYEYIQKIMDENQDLYNNISHFARCGVLRQMRHHGWKQAERVTIQNKEA